MFFVNVFYGKTMRKDQRFVCIYVCQQDLYEQREREKRTLQRYILVECWGDWNKNWMRAES